MNTISKEAREKLMSLLQSRQSIRNAARLVGISKITAMKMARAWGFRVQCPPRAEITRQQHRKKFWYRRNGVNQYQRLLRNISVREQIALLLAISERPLTKEEIWLVLRRLFKDLKLYAVSRIVNHNGDHNIENTNGLLTYNPNLSGAAWYISDKELRHGSPRLMARAIWFRRMGLEDTFIGEFMKRFEQRLSDLEKIKVLRAVDESRLALQFIDAGKELIDVLKKLDARKTIAA